MRSKKKGIKGNQKPSPFSTCIYEEKIYMYIAKDRSWENDVDENISDFISLPFSQYTQTRVERKSR